MSYNAEYHHRYYRLNRAKAAEQSRAWRKNNPERVAEINHRSYQKHREQRRKRAREWKRAHRKVCNAYMRRWRAKNKSHVLAYRRRYREEHCEQINERGRKSYYRNRESRVADKVAYNKKLRAGTATRRKMLLLDKLRNSCVRAKKYGAVVFKVSVADLHTRWKLFDSRCAYCGSRRGGPRGKGLYIDHVKPLSKQGPHHPRNIIPACGRCSCKRNNRPWLSWFRAQPFYSKRRENRIKRVLKGGIR
jgi:hypothetical protein